MGANVIAIDLAKLPRVLAQGARRFEAALARGMRRGAERGRAVMVKRTPADQGQLRASWKVVADALAVMLVNDAPHAGIVELGARPHAVSPQGWAAIYEWVYRHRDYFGFGIRLAAARGAGGKARATTSTKVPSVMVGSAMFLDRSTLEPDLVSITWGIVRKLKTRGQRPTYFVVSALDDLHAVMVAEVDAALDRAIAKAGEGA